MVHLCGHKDVFSFDLTLGEPITQNLSDLHVRSINQSRINTSNAGFQCYIQAAVDTFWQKAYKVGTIRHTALSNVPKGQAKIELRHFDAIVELDGGDFARFGHDGQGDKKKRWQSIWILCDGPQRLSLILVIGGRAAQ